MEENQKLSYGVANAAKGKEWKARTSVDCQLGHVSGQEMA